MTSAATIAELATALGVPSTNLEGTVAPLQRGRRAGHRPRLPQGRQVPGADRHAAVLRCRAASGDRGVDGLRPAHRPLRQRAQQRRPGHPRSVRRRRVHGRRRRRSSTWAAATTTPTAWSSAGSPEPRPRRRWSAHERHDGSGDIPLMPVGQAFDMGQRADGTPLIDPVLFDSAEFKRNPYPYYRILRDHYPVFRDKLHNCYWVTRYEDIEACYIDEAGVQHDPQGLVQRRARQHPARAERRRAPAPAQHLRPPPRRRRTDQAAARLAAPGGRR